METKLVKPENVLKKKAGSGGFDERTLINAQSMIENNSIDFEPLARDLLKGLKDVLAGIESNPSAATKEQIDEVMYPLMQLKSQGTLFHYSAITKMSHIVLDFIENISSFDEDVIQIISAYKKSVKAVLKLKIKNDNAKVAKDLCKELTDVCARYKIKNK